MEPDYMNLTNAPPPYETMTCTETDLATKLAEGWTVMHAYHKYDLVPTFGSVPNPYGGTNSVQNGQVAVPVPHFVIGRSSTARMQWLESAWRLLCLEVEDNRTRAAASQKSINELRKIEADLTKAKTAMTEDRDRYARLFDEEQKSVRTLSEVNRKLETDLGKVRSAIGDLKFNEIVNPKRE